MDKVIHPISKVEMKSALRARAAAQLAQTKLDEAREVEQEALNSAAIAHCAILFPSIIPGARVHIEYPSQYSSLKLSRKRSGPQVWEVLGVTGDWRYINHDRIEQPDHIVVLVTVLAVKSDGVVGTLTATERVENLVMAGPVAQ